MRLAAVWSQMPRFKFDLIVWIRLTCTLISVQDANVRLIRELREEIDRLKSMLLSFEMVW